MSLAITLDTVFNIVKIVIFGFIVIVALISVLSSEISMGYLTRNLARSVKNVTARFKEQGINKVDVEGKINLGLMSLKVQATDERA